MLFANSSIGQFNELNSWVEFRQAYEQNVSFKDWVIASATSNNPLQFKSGSTERCGRL